MQRCDTFSWGRVVMSTFDQLYPLKQGHVARRRGVGIRTDKPHLLKIQSIKGHWLILPQLRHTHLVFDGVARPHDPIIKAQGRAQGRWEEGGRAVKEPRLLA